MALALGLLMSAGLYFAYLWPQVEPDEDEVPAEDAPKPAPAEAADDVKADEPAAPSAKEEG
jgi:hypothetical protein